jgi:hypothetical protein
MAGGGEFFMKKNALLLVIVAFLSIHCADETLSGRYRSDHPTLQMELEFDGDTAYLSLLGNRAARSYRVEGDKLFLGPEGAEDEYTLNADGSITGASQTFRQVGE